MSLLRMNRSGRIQITHRMQSVAPLGKEQLYLGWDSEGRGLSTGVRTLIFYFIMAEGTLSKKPLGQKAGFLTSLKCGYSSNQEGG